MTRNNMKARITAQRRAERARRLAARLVEIAKEHPEDNPHHLLADEENRSVWTIYKALAAK